MDIQFSIQTPGYAEIMDYCITIITLSILLHISVNVESEMIDLIITHE